MSHGWGSCPECNYPKRRVPHPEAGPANFYVLCGCACPDCGRKKDHVRGRDRCLQFQLTDLRSEVEHLGRELGYLREKVEG